MPKEQEVVSRPRKRKNPITAFFQLIISLMIFTILGLGLYLAFRSFSGLDPLTLSPSGITHKIVNSDSAFNFLNKILSFSPGIVTNTVIPDSTTQPKITAPLKFKFAIVADSHKDTADLTKALNQAKQSNVKFVIGMGDFSDVGTKEELTATKTVFDKSGLTYYVTPGDHDLWDSRDKKFEAIKNFKEIFGDTYQSFSYSNVRFILIDNSDNYLGLDPVQQTWVENELKRVSSDSSNKLIFVFLTTPLYHPSSDHVMGKVDPSLKDQSNRLMSLFSKYNVTETFSGDTHFYSQYTEPSTKIKMTTVGAVTSDRNLQTPRFAIVDVYQDGSYNVEETEIK